MQAVTILIESALMARNIAPGLRRGFAAEKFGFIPQSVWQQERGRALAQIDNTVTFKAIGSDVDPQSIALAAENAKKAGVDGCVSVHLADVKDFVPTTERGVVVTNPPYGERLLDIKTAEQLYKVLGEVCPSKKGYKYNVISSDDNFEKCFGRPADKRRKLYNGSIRCQLYMYFK